MDLDQQRAEERVGATINGKYFLEAVLGVGGMAAVYAASHRNRKRVAIKMLHRELSAITEMRERFLREGYVANTVNHAGAVAVLDDDTAEDGSAYLVMELLDGESIEKVLERRSVIPIAETLEITRQMLEVLSAGHRRGVIHRDLKPANLLLTTAGVLKILDFGIARLRENNDSASATKTGIGMGTPMYMAPEQARGKMREIGPWTDLWSAGAVMFELITGRFVREGESAQELMVIAATQPVRKIGEVLPDLPARIAIVVDRALAFDRAERWQSADEMLAALREAMSELASPNVPAEWLAALVDASAHARAPTARPPAFTDETSGASLAKLRMEPRSLPPPKEKSGDTFRTALNPALAATPPPQTLPTSESAPSRAPLFVGGAIAIAIALGVLAFFLRGTEHATTDTAVPRPPLSATPLASASAPNALADRAPNDPVAATDPPRSSSSPSSSTLAPGGGGSEKPAKPSSPKPNASPPSSSKPAGKVSQPTRSIYDP